MAGSVETELLGATRLECSRAGNERWELHTGNGAYPTLSDASCNYDVENLVWGVRARRGRVMVRLHLTPDGRVYQIDRL